MGYLLIADGAGGKKEFDTVSCCHCQGIIKLVVQGLPGAKPTRFRCNRCDAPICRHCAEVLGGKCSPFRAKLEEAIKTGRWPSDHEYEYKILPG